MNFETLAILFLIDDNVLDEENCLPVFSKELFNSLRETGERIVFDFGFPPGPGASWSEGEPSYMPPLLITGQRITIRDKIS